MSKLCIIAGNYEQAQRYARGAGLSRRDWFYPHDDYQMRGLRDYKYIRVGDWGSHPNIHAIDIQLRIANAKEITCVDEVKP